MRSLLFTSVILGLAVTATPLFSQAPTEVKPSFEVASIKPSTSGTPQGITIQPGGRLVINGVPLGLLIAIAYHLQAFQISGAEGWMMKDQWSIEAKTEEGTVIPAWTLPYIPDAMAIRLQSLLADRFALKTHRETRELQVYTLNLSKNGSKLKAVDPPQQQTPGRLPPPGTPAPLGPDGTIPANFAPPPGATLAGPGAILASAITMDRVVNLLGRLVDRPVIDKTGLIGYFNVRLQFAPETAPRMGSGAAPAGGSPLAPPTTSDPDGPSIFTAIQEQLGLRLEPAKEPVEVLVIDSAQKPTEN